MHHPAVPIAVVLLLGVAVGVRSPGLSSGTLVVVILLTWVCAAISFSRAQTGLTTRCALASFLAVGLLLGAQATTRATTTELWQWYQSQPSLTSDRPVLVEGRLTLDQVPTEYGARLDLRVDRLLSQTGWTGVDGGVSVTVGGGQAAAYRDAWLKGRRLLMPITLRPAARYANPGVPDQRRALMWRGTSLLGSVKSALLIEVVDNGGWWSETAATIRSQVRRRVDQTVGQFSLRSSGVVTAVLVGDRAGLSAADRRRLQEAGTYHVIAISGGNIAILSAVLLLAARGLGCSRRTASVVTIGCVLGYGSVVGSEASVARATFAASVFLGAMAADHRTAPLNTLALSAVCLAAVSPLLVVDAGFLLTFGATLGILVGAAPLLDAVQACDGRFRWLGARIAMPVVALMIATLCAEFALLPIAATAFSRVTIAGLVLNLVAIPLMTVTQVAGLLAVCPSVASERLATMIGYCAHLAASGIVESARLVDLLPWLSWRVAAPGLALTVAYYGGWWMCLGRPTNLWRRSGAGLAVAAGALIVYGPIDLARGASSCRGLAAPLELLFLDVDQADATLVKLPSGRSLLVDTGGTVRGTFDVGARIVSPVLWATGVRRLDYLALTHGDPDHIGGAPAVISDFRPREVWTGVPVPQSQRLDDLQQLSYQAGAAWRVLQKGDRLLDGGVTIHAWHPSVPEWERHDVRNDDSLVIEIRYGRVSVVLPGDIGSAIEAGLSREIPPAPLRVLKVPHHGSRTSSSDAFVTALRPRVAVVSAGRHNRFGQPAPDVVQRYLDTGTMLLHTADGAVSVCTDGEYVSLATPVFPTPVVLAPPPSSG